MPNRFTENVKRKRAKLPRERLMEYMSYDPDSGIFSRLKAERAQVSHHIGNPVGWKHSNGYWIVEICGVKHRAHHLAWLVMTGEWPKDDIDHINRNRSDNRWCNLRSATRAQNLHNVGLRKTNKSGIKGVSFDASRNKWKAQIRVNGAPNKLIGRFDTKDAAAQAYRYVAEKHFAEFAGVG